MAKSSFGRGFSREFRPGSAANIWLHNLLIGQRQKQAEERELGRIAQEETQQRNSIAELLDPKQRLYKPTIDGSTPTEFAYAPPQLDMRTGQFTERPKDITRTVQLLNNLPAGTRNIVQDLLKPEEKPDKFSYLKFTEPDAIYGFSEKQQKMVKMQDDNPFFELNIEPITTERFFRKSDNQKVFRKYYSEEDARKLGLPEGINYTELELGHYKRATGGGEEKEVIDLDKNKQFTQKYSTKHRQLNIEAQKYYDLFATDEQRDIAQLKSQGLTDAEVAKQLDISKGSAEEVSESPNLQLKELINQKADQQEIEFFNGMIPPAREYVNREYYNQLKGTDAPENFEYTERVGLQEDFIQDVTEDYQDGELNSGDFKINISDYPIPKDENGNPKMSKEEWKREIEAQTYNSILLWAKLKFDRL
jgi:hypothetical protein